MIHPERAAACAETHIEGSPISRLFVDGTVGRRVLRGGAATTSTPPG
jgi:hypothetical protein